MRSQKANYLAFKGISFNHETSLLTFQGDRTVVFVSMVPVVGVRVHICVHTI